MADRPIGDQKQWNAPQILTKLDFHASRPTGAEASQKPRKQRPRRPQWKHGSGFHNPRSNAIQEPVLEYDKQDKAATEQVGAATHEDSSLSKEQLSNGWLLYEESV